MLLVAPEISPSASDHWYVNVPTPSSSDTPLVSAVNVSPSYAVPVIEILPVEASCVLATVISKDAESVAEPSETLNDTVWVPTCELSGVPVSVAVPSPLSVKDSQLGFVVAS